MDTYGGVPDISFHRLERTNARVASEGPYALNAIAADLRVAGLVDEDKVLLVYYDGVSTTACGNAEWSPLQHSAVGALYLQGEPPGFSCNTIPLASSASPTGYWEYSGLHEILHLVGFVPECAPHNAALGHVADSPNDLMYAGDEPWTPTQVDVGRDDYFMASVPGCSDLSQSPYLEASP